jgi:hypothetical protein
VNEITLLGPYPTFQNPLVFSLNDGERQN